MFESFLIEIVGFVNPEHVFRKHVVPFVEGGEFLLGVVVLQLGGRRIGWRTDFVV